MKLGISALTVLLAAAGCTTMPQQTPQEGLRQNVAARTEAELLWQHDPRVRERAAAEVAALLEAELTPESAVRIGLLNNRELQAMFAELDVAAGEYFDAVTLPNPILDLETHWVRGGSASAAFVLTQPVMRLLTRPARRRSAEAWLEAKALETADRVLELMRDIEQAFLEVQAAAEAEAILTQSVQATGAAWQVAEALYEAENIPRLHVERERQLHEETRLRLLRAEALHEARREAFNRQLGLWGEQTRWRLNPRLPPVPAAPAIPPASELEREAVASLRLAALESRVAAAAQDAGLADTTALLPSLTLGASVEGSGRDRELGPTAALPLPLFDRGQGRRARAHGTLESLHHQWWQEAVAARSRAREAVYQYQAAREQARHAEEILLPLATRVLELTLRDYNAMQADAFDLLLARRAQIEAGMRYVEGRRDYWIARLNVQHLGRGGTSLRPPSFTAGEPSVESRPTRSGAP